MNFNLQKQGIRPVLGGEVDKVFYFWPQALHNCWTLWPASSVYGFQTPILVSSLYLFQLSSPNKYGIYNHSWKIAVSRDKHKYPPPPPHHQLSF